MSALRCLNQIQLHNIVGKRKRERENIHMWDEEI